MASFALHLVVAAQQGHNITQQVSTVSPWQFETYFTELSPHCPDRVEPEVTRRPANALIIEFSGGRPRCLQQSPDGRGLAWYMSGGSVLAYGVCSCASCPRTKNER